MRKIGLALPVVGIAALLCFLALRPVAPLTTAPLPNPNGYDDFRRAGRMKSTNDSDYRSMREVDLRKLVALNAGALELVRSGLIKNCAVPIEFSTNYFEKHLSDLASIKRIALWFLAEGRMAELDNRSAAAAQIYLEAIQFSHEAVRGGMVIDKLVGIAIESMALTALENLSPRLEADDCQKALRSLQDMELKAEGLEEAFEKEAASSRREGLMLRLMGMLAFRTLHPERSSEKKIRPHFNALEQRKLVLITNLAAQVRAASVR